MSGRQRPTPEELLRRYRLSASELDDRRGQLRVYLGAAPGVGKSFAMLNDGRRLQAAGRDIVVGFVETHGRTETAAQIGDLEVIPRREVVHRGVMVEEMDTEAVLSRRPEIVLVDELAHTNAPGSPCQKRYQDIELLRDAGINVVTTMNVQHLEGLQDVVAGITGIQVRETIPDQILDDATEVQLVDLPVETLIERLEQGKVYPAERARQALEHFFRAGNLTALRELALRRTAAGVDERLEDYMREHGIEEVWPAAERVVALIDDSPDMGVVLRQAWRLASAMRGELVVIAIAPPADGGVLPVAQRTRLDRNLRLAEDLGASILTMTAKKRDVASALAHLLSEENATVLVLGQRPGKRWTWPWTVSLADDVLHLVDGVGIYLVETGGQPGPS